MLPSRRVSWIIAVVVLGAGVLIAFATRSAWSPSSSTTSSGAAPAERLPFIADDYTQAVALARERKLPLFIESWAPW